MVKKIKKHVSASKSEEIESLPPNRILIITEESGRKGDVSLKMKHSCQNGPMVLMMLEIAERAISQTLEGYNALFLSDEAMTLKLEKKIPDNPDSTFFHIGEIEIAYAEVDGAGVVEVVKSTFAYDIMALLTVRQCAMVQQQALMESVKSNLVIPGQAGVPGMPGVPR